MAGGIVGPDGTPIQSEKQAKRILPPEELLQTMRESVPIIAHSQGLQFNEKAIAVAMLDFGANCFATGAQWAISVGLDDNADIEEKLEDWVLALRDDVAEDVERVKRAEEKRKRRAERRAREAAKTDGEA